MFFFVTIDRRMDQNGTEYFFVKYFFPNAPNLTKLFKKVLIFLGNVRNVKQIYFYKTQKSSFIF